MSSAVIRPRRSGVFAALPVQPLPALTAPSGNEIAAALVARDPPGRRVVARLPEVGLDAALDVAHREVAVAGRVGAGAERDADRDRAALARCAGSRTPDRRTSRPPSRPPNRSSPCSGCATLAVTRGASEALLGSSGACARPTPTGHAEERRGDVAARDRGPASLSRFRASSRAAWRPGPEPGIGVPLDGLPPRRCDGLRPCGRAVIVRGHLALAAVQARPRAGGRSSGGRCAGRGRRSCGRPVERWRSAL